MTQLDTESDPFLKLLTDALRAGPNSPQWHAAVEQLRASGRADADEYQMILAAREHLASGKEYRSVRAGAGFTRKVFAGIENESAATGARRTLPVATLVAVLAGLAIVAVVVLVAWQLAPHAKPGEGAVDALAQTYFPTDVASVTFDKTAKPVPPGWRTIGALPLDTAGGLHPAAAPAPATNPATTEPTTAPAPDAAGGGIVTTQSLSAAQPFALEAELHLPAAAASSALVPQVFVSASDDFSPDRATSPHELVWLVRGNTQHIAADGTVLPTSENQPLSGTVKVRIVLDRDLVVVESNGKRLFGGPHALDPNAPRYVGVRFIRTGPAGPAPAEAPAVQSVRVSTR